jgi:hypothetical protein
VDNDNLYSRFYRTDERLDAILDEAAEWALHARRGRLLCRATSLRDALEKSSVHAGSGLEVACISRYPTEDIVLHSDQIGRMIRHTGKVQRRENVRPKIVADSRSARQRRAGDPGSRLPPAVPLVDAPKSETSETAA